MIVREVGVLMAERERMTLRELARHFHAAEETMDAMLGVWMRKGRIRKVTQSGCSGRCCGAREETQYEWLPEGQIGLVQRN
jgi:putative ferrous iron transport protein C